MSEEKFIENPNENPLKIGVVGMGSRARCFLDYFSQNPWDGKVVALCDSIEEKAEFFKKEFFAKAPGPEMKIYKDIVEMLEKSPIDALFIATPDFEHVKPAIEALQREIHVYCEKPMATTLEDCDLMIEQAKKTDAVLYLGFNLRHSPVYATIHELIQSGRLGVVSTIEANEYYYGGKTYFRRWNRFREFGGGLWVTKATHDFDLLNYMAGSQPKKVFAVGDLSYYGPKAEAGTVCRECSISDSCPDYYNVFNHGIPESNEHARGSNFHNRLLLVGEAHGQEPGDLCLFNSQKDTFDNGMAVVTYENGIKASYALNVAGSRTTRQMRILGDKAALEADLTSGTITIVERHTFKEEKIDVNNMMKGSHSGADNLIIKDFLLTIKEGTKPITGWAEGKLSIQVSLAARDSMDSGQVVEL